MADLIWSEAQRARLNEIARAAGASIMQHRPAVLAAAFGSAEKIRKPDGSPVTIADHAAQAIIIAGLAELTPDIPVIAEEQAHGEPDPMLSTYWLVDPLDGTRDYVRGGDEFCVSIGLINQGQPYLGIIYAPAFDDLFYGDPKRAYRTQKGVTTELKKAAPLNPTTPPRLLTSRSKTEHLEAQQWLDDQSISAWQICSSAYKYGLLAANEYNIALRLGITQEWDTAAGDAILRSVGGAITTPDKKPLHYGKPNYQNGAFIGYNASTAENNFIQQLANRLAAPTAG